MADAEMVSASAINDVISERLRQVDEEHNSIVQDDEYTNNELVRAAFCYASPHAVGREPSATPSNQWPWGAEWWKPKNRRRDLVRAAALLVAEIERMDRANEA